MKMLLPFFNRLLSWIFLIMITSYTINAKCNFENIDDWQFSNNKEVIGLTTSVYKKFTCNCNNYNYIIYGIGDFNFSGSILFVGIINNIDIIDIDCNSNNLIKILEEHCNENKKMNSSRNKDQKKAKKEKRKKDKIRKKPTYDNYTDKRNHHSYKTVKLDKNTWMVENMNYRTLNSICYERSNEHCENFGRLYNFKEAMEVCPTGWGLPTKIEWESVNKYKLHPVINLLPSGIKLNLDYKGLNEYGEYWLGDGGFLNINKSDGSWTYYSQKVGGISKVKSKKSVRCIKNNYK